MMPPDRIDRLLEQGTIEVAPLAFMRGRTLNDAFIILDEAQNTTPEQMKMFLTRMGYDSKAVITGDITQIDLPGGHALGPARDDARSLDGVEGIGFGRLTSRDVVRHYLVGRIVVAYDALQRVARRAAGRGLLMPGHHHDASRPSTSPA